MQFSILRNSVQIVLVCLVSWCCENVAQATVVTLAQYRAGDDDPGAIAGQPGNDPTVDSIGGLNLAVGGGAPAYSSNTAGPGSVLSLDFSGSDSDYYERTGIVTSATDNWGVEAWVFPTADPPGNSAPSNFAVVAFNGETNASGFGLVTQGSEWKILRGGVAFHDVNATVTINQWVHLAAVRDSGLLSLYVNGVQIGGTDAGAPNTPAGFTHIGGESITPNGDRSFIGLIDEVRFFSFASGQFNPITDLTLSLPAAPVPEPSTFVLVTLGLFVTLRRRRRGLR